MVSKLPRATIRIEKIYIDKVTYIAAHSRPKRSRNALLRGLIIRYVLAYEREHGTIAV